MLHANTAHQVHGKTAKTANSLAIQIAADTAMLRTNAAESDSLLALELVLATDTRDAREANPTVRPELKPEPNRSASRWSTGTGGTDYPTCERFQVNSLVCSFAAIDTSGAPPT